jgi:hypothetical protein
MATIAFPGKSRFSAEFDYPMYMIVEWGGDLRSISRIKSVLDQLIRLHDLLVRGSKTRCG